MSGPKARIAAVGAGRMGRGIAHVFAYSGHPVDLIDLKPRDEAASAKLAAEALAEVKDNLDTLTRLGVMDGGLIPSILSRISFVPASGAAAAMAKADVIFEGVPEKLEAKKEALAEIDRLARPDAIIASTTSSMLVEELAEFVVRKGRFLNAHWLNPAYLVPLVEMSPGKATDPAVTDRLKALLEAAHKVPVICQPAPGFIVPRMQGLAMCEAARIVEEGVASPEDIDKATRYGFGFRFSVLGLIEFNDFGGNDTLYNASRYLAQKTGQARYEPPAIVAKLMEEGKIGLKSGHGFYDYSKMDVEAYKADVIARFVAQLDHMGMIKPPYVEPAVAVASQPAKSAISVRGLGKTFSRAGKDVVAMRGFDLEVNEGEFIAIVGPSGCGKSTFLHMLGGFEPVTEGQLLVEGKPVAGPGPDRGVVFQEFALYPWRTVTDNVTWSQEVQHKSKAERRSVADRLLAKVGLSHFRDHYPAELSGGMKQRVAIARTLAFDPRILLMDEPFGALDAQNRELMQEELQLIWNEARKTVVFITHDIEEAVYLADRVIVFTARPGRVKADIRIDLPRPRAIEIKKSAAYMAYRNQVWDLLRDEVLEARKEFA